MTTPPTNSTSSVTAHAAEQSDSLRAIERPEPARVNAAAFGSDVVAETLRGLDLPYIALTPGASYRGLHDSLVNYLGNERPQILLCLHEEHAIAIAHGYAKVTGRPIATAVHSNVGLFHATMAIFNAWCDRMPVIVLGATGPVDAVKRRPWIDWIHTARDQGAIVRGYVKWDDQPASPEAAREALLRAAWIAETAPKGPVYVNLDAGMQEARLEAPVRAVDEGRFRPQVRVAPPGDLVDQTARILKAATRPVILAGRVSRGLADWNSRVALAECINARVVTDLKVAAAFPTGHPLHAGAPGTIGLGKEASAAVRDADVILSLDWLDLAGTLQSVFEGTDPTATVIQASVDHTVHNGWSMDYQGLAPVDVMLAADPDVVVEALNAALSAPSPGERHDRTDPLPRMTPGAADGTIHVTDLAEALREAVGERACCLTHLPLSWDGASWPFNHPLDYLGSDGGGGVGGGPGIAVGAALALKDSGRLPIAICGDGDFLMGVTALWTATHYRIPLLMVVANNQSFFNDELHQERVARMRGRPTANRWIGQRISDPDIDLAAMGRAQGAIGMGPLTRNRDLRATLRDAVVAASQGQVVVVDVHVEPGYAAATTLVMTRSQSS